jgi:hypothetical protein
MQSNVGIPFISDFNARNEINWQMSRAEKYCLINLLQHLKPETAIEIGTFMGGSLQVLNDYVKNIYSIDISSAPKSFLENQYGKVDFRVGDSSKILPDLLQEIESKGQKLEFILVDGDHTTKAVRKDIEAILNYTHKNPVTIILHDSFNPQCRKGIKSIKYDSYPSVCYVELDYIGGSYWHNDTFREMWGGFAIIRTDPDHKGGVSINASLEKMYKRLYWGSIHVLKDHLQFLVPLKQKLFRKFGLSQKIDMYNKFD